MNSMRSVKIIMEYILEDVATNDYYDLMMLELPKLLEIKEIDVKNFFKNEEVDDDDNQLPPLFIEKPLNSD